MMRKVWVAGVLLVFGLAVTATTQAGGKSDKDKLQGSWKVTKMTVGGKEFPSDGKQSVLVITGNKSVMKEEGRPDAEAIITLDETKKLKVITITPSGKGKEMQGIYKLESDTFTVALTKPGDPLPTAFEGKEVMVMTFTKVKSK